MPLRIIDTWCLCKDTQAEGRVKGHGGGLDTAVGNNLQLRVIVPEQNTK